MNGRERIIKILGELGVDEWIIREERISSREFFFIRKDLDMNRAKRVACYRVTLFRLYEEEGQLFKGSAQIILPEGMGDGETVRRLEKAWFASSFVKNPPYPMADGVTGPVPVPLSPLMDEEPIVSLEKIYLGLYGEGREEGINSAEIFLNRREYRLLTSRGTDVSYSLGTGEVELICEWKGERENVEIYNMFSFADPEGDIIARESRDQIEDCRLRSRAVKAPDLKEIPVILSGEAVREIMDFYLKQSNAKLVYEKIARTALGEVFQGEDARGDLVSISLEPALAGSPYGEIFDEDGTALKKWEIYRNGKLLRYHGNVQYCHYLQVPPTGQIRNLVVDGGETSVEEWRKSPHVEIRSFSAFQMDPFTGDFGGEVRLALWFDGKRNQPLTGASLSACLFDVQKEFYLSRETLRWGHYQGPAYLMYPRGHLAG